MIRKNCYAIARAYGGNNPRLTKCNCLAGYRVQPAPTRPGARRTSYILSLVVYLYA